MKTTHLIIALSVASASLIACGGSQSEPARSPSSQASMSGSNVSESSAPEAKPDIVDTAVAAGSFNTLVKAVQVAGLVETLKSEGPFTVFAPTDEAFAKLPAGTLDQLLEDKEALTNILTYHVVPGRVTSDEVVGLSSARTVQGSDLRIDTSNGVRIDNASLLQADIQTSNGVIHVIDTVLIPSS